MDGILTKFQEFLSFTGLNESVSTILTAILVLFFGWIIARSIRKLIYRTLKKATWDEKLLGDSMGGLDSNSFISKLVYYLLMLVVLLVVLEIMGISQVLDPLKNMLNEFFSYIPNLLAALVIGFVGYIIATFASNLISMTGSVLDSFAEKTGFKDTDKLVNILKKLVFVFILLLFVIQALNALNLDAITRPANEILSEILGILPNVLGAAAVIGLFVVGGRFLTSLLEDLLRSFGTDSLSQKMRLSSIIGENQSLSKIISGIAFFFLVFFGIIVGVEMLEMEQLNTILNSILSVTGQIFFGLIILVLGNFIATLIFDSLSKSENNKFIAPIIRFAIIGLFLAISLRTMGIANSIVELAFGLTLGSVAIAVALAYGLGGREAAGEHAKDILRRVRGKKN